jgi:hypothetical protein
MEFMKWQCPNVAGVDHPLVQFLLISLGLLFVVGSLLPNLKARRPQSG